MFKKLISFSVDHPKIVIFVTAVLVLLALTQILRIKVDTDPENMLPKNAPARTFHRDIKKEFGLYDLVVLGVVNKNHPDGVFNVKTLEKVYAITKEIEQIDGVIKNEIISLSTKDNIEQGGVGTVRFNWLMAEPPKTSVEALNIRNQAENHPMFAGSVVSEDGKALAIYIPIEQKDISYEVAQDVRQILQKYQGDEEYFITGLPVANDQFGVEMFKQMAVSAPLAGLIIFLLLWAFFRSVALIVAPMLVALATVIITMGLLIGFGFPVHIMSSMIPIFLMPISVLDSVHILSEFFDKYRKTHDKRKTMMLALEELFSPMLFTSLTSAVGFFSLSFSPIPPVQVFGVFVAIGVMLAWVLTITLIPAYAMLLNEKAFKNFGLDLSAKEGHLVDRFLSVMRYLTTKRYKLVLSISVILVVLSFIGISRIQVNDNPVRWFNKKHPIRVADKILNEHFSGTYMAYLVMESKQEGEEVFIEPAMLNYLEKLQQYLLESGYVGKITSIGDIVKKIYYELLGGDKANSVIPNSKAAVAQCLISFENSHKPDDLWHLVTPDYSKTTLWLQLKSGDNKYMSKVIQLVDNYIKQNPPPYEISHNWAGLTYINVVWQDNMVVGMLKNFLGSFVIVLFMMLFLFRSPIKALISMIPLTITILFIYSLLGFFGKDYDMPVAVLSALTLGLSVDFAIHFIQRAIEVNDEKQSWLHTADEMFQGPGRAIVRNALVVAIGFLPLLAAPLVPYKTVGFFMFAIMAVSSLATLFIIPSIISANAELVFGRLKNGLSCNCGQCVLISFFVAFGVGYVLFGYSPFNWKISTILTISVIVMAAVLCHFASKRKICLTVEEQHEE